MTTLDEAREAKYALAPMLVKDGPTPWLVHIGVAYYERDYCVMVGVKAPEDAERLPESFHGVRVIVQVRGGSHAQEGP